MNKTIVISLLLAGLAGCSMAPVYQQPQSPVEKQIGEPTEANAAIGDWKKWFADSALQAVIEQALANNRDLRISLENLEVVRGQYGVQKADRLPNINANAGYSASRTPAAANSSGRDVYSRTYSANLGLVSYELDFWGRVQNLSEAALETYLASEEGQRTTQLTLISNIASNWYAAASLDARVEFAQKTVEAREAYLKVIQNRANAGTATRMDVLSAETTLDSAKSDLASLSNQREQALNNLAVLAGGKIAQPKVAKLDAPLLPAGLSSETLLKRPDIRQAEHSLKAANANIGAARAAFFPSVNLVASFGLASSELDGLFNGGNRAWSFAPAIRLPIFDGGRNSANLSIAEARKNIAVAQYEKAIQQAFAETANLLADQRWITEQLEVQQRQAVRQEERLKLAEARYQAGLVGYLELLDAQRDHYSAQQALLELQRSRMAVAAQAYKVLGGI